MTGGGPPPPVEPVSSSEAPPVLSPELPPSLESAAPLLPTLVVIGEGDPLVSESTLAPDEVPVLVPSSLPPSAVAPPHPKPKHTTVATAQRIP